MKDATISIPIVASSSYLTADLTLETCDRNESQIKKILVVTSPHHIQTHGERQTLVEGGWTREMCTRTTEVAKSQSEATTDVAMGKSIPLSLKDSTRFKRHFLNATHTHITSQSERERETLSGCTL